MGIFGNEAERLLRESWPNATELAEELFAIFNSTNPLQISGPVQITNDTTDPPLTIKNLGGTNTQIQIQSRQPAVPTLPGVPPLPTLDPGPGITSYWNLYNGGNTETWNFGTPNPPNPTPGTGTQGDTSGGGGGGGGTPAQVKSGGPGSGPYTIVVYPSGPSGAGQTVQATQLQIDSGARVPAGTWTFASQVGGQWYMQVPVWLDGGGS